jgi:hypothetical protein
VSIELEKAIYSKLSGDNGAGGVATLSTGGIHQLFGTQGGSFPKTIFQELTFIHNYTFTARAFIKGFYQFKAMAIDPVNTTDQGVSLAGAIVDRIVTLLTDPGFTVTGSSLLYCRPTHSLPPSVEWDKENGRSIYHKGIICEMWLTN